MRPRTFERSRADGQRIAVERFAGVRPSAVASLGGPGAPRDLLLVADGGAGPAWLEAYDHLLGGWWRTVERYRRSGAPPIVVVICADAARAHALARSRGRAADRGRRAGRSRPAAMAAGRARGDPFRRRGGSAPRRSVVAAGPAAAAVASRRGLAASRCGRRSRSCPRSPRPARRSRPGAERSRPAGRPIVDAAGR